MGRGGIRSTQAVKGRRPITAKRDCCPLLVRLVRDAYLASVRGWRWTWRSLLRRPGFTLSVVALAGAGIGVLCAVLGVADSVLIRPLPYRNASRTVVVGEWNNGER